jgi:hypothetical protein
MMDIKLATFALILVAVAASSGCFTYTGVVKDEVNITGSALSPYNITYYIEVAEGWNPRNWSTLGVSIANNSAKVNESVLGLVDTTYFPDGNYSIRLTVTDEFNQSSRDVVFVSVDNVKITYPEDYDVIARGTQVEVKGTVLGHFTRYYIEHGQGIAPQNYSEEGVTLSGGGMREVNNGTLGVWNTSTVSTAGVYVIRLFVEYEGNRTYSENVTVIIDIFAEGWPNTINASFMSPPLFVDIDGDCGVDVLAASGDGMLYAWNLSGNILPGWPVSIGESLYYSPPMPAVGDIDGDGILEIVVAGLHTTYAFKADGSNASAWPVNVTEYITTAPLLYDLNSDMKLEVLFGAENRIYALKHDGTSLEGWPVSASSSKYNDFVMLSAGDVNGDKNPEVVASSYYDYIHVYNLSGVALTGWPKAPANMTRPYDVSLADYNSDGVFDILVGADSGKVAVMYGNGSYSPGFPKSVGGSWTTVYTSASDLDGNGVPEIIASTSDGMVYVLTANGSNFGEEAEGSMVNQTIESEHPYGEDFDYTWSVSVPNASSLAVHFERIDVESGFDYLYILDGDGRVVENFTGAYNDVWSKTVSGSTVKIRLVSDYMIEEWGFKADKILNGSVTKRWPVTSGSMPSYASVGDLDGGSQEVFVGSFRDSRYLLSSFHANGSSVEGWPKYMKGSMSWSPTLGGLTSSATNIGVTSGRGLYIWKENESFDVSSVQWGSLNHDLHNTRAYVNPLSGVQVLAPLANATFLTTSQVIFSFIPWDVEISSCSMYSNASGVFAEDRVIGRVVSQQTNNFSYNLTAKGFVSWSIVCRNYNGFNVSTDPARLMNILTNLSANVSFINVTNESAIVSATTNYPTTLTVDYGASPAYGTRLHSNETNLTHALLLSNLSSFTTYYLNATVSDDYGRNTSTGRLNFTTKLYATSKLNLSFNQSVEVNITEGGLNLSLNIKSNTTKENVTLIVNATRDNPTNASLALTALGKFLDISLLEAEGEIEWLHLKVDYTDEEVLAANINETSLAFYWLNGTSGEWLKLNTSTMSWVYGTGVDMGANFVWANVSRTSQYTIAGERLLTTRQQNLTAEWNLVSIPLII